VTFAPLRETALSLMLLAPRGVFFLQQLRGFVDVPVVTRAALVFDLSHFVFHHSITPDKNWSISPDFIEPRPDWTSLRIFDYHPTNPFPTPFEAAHLLLPNPRTCRLTRLHHRWRWIFDRHQEPHNPDTLAATQRDHFKLSRRRRRERDFIVLCA